MEAFQYCPIRYILDAAKVTRSAPSLSTVTIEINFGWGVGRVLDVRRAVLGQVHNYGIFYKILRGCGLGDLIYGYRRQSVISCGKSCKDVFELSSQLLGFPLCSVLAREWMSDVHRAL